MLIHNIAAVSRLTGISVTAVKKSIQDGDLVAAKNEGGQWEIDVRDIHTWVDWRGNSKFDLAVTAKLLTSPSSVLAKGAVHSIETAARTLKVNESTIRDAVLKGVLKYTRSDVGRPLTIDGADLDEWNKIRPDTSLEKPLRLAKVASNLGTTQARVKNALDRGEVSGIRGSTGWLVYEKSVINWLPTHSGTRKGRPNIEIYGPIDEHHDDDMVRTSVVSQLTGASSSMISAAINSGELPCDKSMGTSRIRVGDLNAWLSDRMNPKYVAMRREARIRDEKRRAAQKEGIVLKACPEPTAIEPMPIVAKPSEPIYHSYRSASKFANIPKTTLGRALASGALAARKTKDSWLIDEKDLIKWIEDRKKSSKGPVGNTKSKSVATQKNTAQLTQLTDENERLKAEVAMLGRDLVTSKHIIDSMRRLLSVSGELDIA